MHNFLQEQVKFLFISIILYIFIYVFEKVKIKVFFSKNSVYSINYTPSPLVLSANERNITARSARAILLRRRFSRLEYQIYKPLDDTATKLYRRFATKAIGFKDKKFGQICFRSTIFIK